MKLWGKRLIAAACAGMMILAAAGNALAAETRTEIKQIALTIASNIEAGNDTSDVGVTTVSATGYWVEDVTVKNDAGGWVNGDKPQLEITLEANADFYFGSIGKSKVKLYGDKATYMTSSRKNDKSTLVLTVQLNALKGGLELETAAWESESSPVATWDAIAGAQKYEVRLFRSEQAVGSVVSTSKEYYDFRKNITKPGDYFFRVRAISNDSKGEWLDSDSISIDEDMVNDFKEGNFDDVEDEEPSTSGSSRNTSNSSHTTSGGSQNTSGSSPATPGTSESASASTSVQGTWKSDLNGWWYEYPDGSYPVGQWLQINNLWYCFDSNGYMQLGWIMGSDGKWYYCDTREGASQGVMLTNTITPDGYQVDASGARIQ